VYVKDSGVWREVRNAYIKYSGTWRHAYANAVYVLGSGGTLITEGDYNTHTFTDSEVFTISSGGNAAGYNVLEVSLSGGGGGGGGRNCNNLCSGIPALINGSSGGTTTVALYDSSNTLKETYTALGGSGGNSQVSTSGPAPNGVSYTNGGVPSSLFTGVGGTGAYGSSTIYLAGDATGSASGGGGGGGNFNNWEGMFSGRWDEEGGQGSFTNTFSISLSDGDYVDITIGGGGSGGGNGNGGSIGNVENYGAGVGGGDGSPGVVAIKYKFQE
jgi:hypothetical protein